jgi:hypothetical protein
MGQKVNPIGFRLGISKQWRSRWYANRDFPQLLKEDELLRKYLKARLGHAAISDITIERKPGKVVVTVHTGRPGVVIGKKGAEVDKLRDELAQLTGKEVGINVEEIKRPELDSQAWRRGDRARRGLPRGPRAVAHAARGHRLRDVDREDDLRHHRGEGVDLQGRDRRGSPRQDLFDGRLATPERSAIGHQRSTLLAPG